MCPGPPRHIAAASAVDVDALAAELGAEVLATTTVPGAPGAVIARAAIVAAARFLRDARGYQLLLSVTAIDLLPAEPRFVVVYHFSALPAHVLAGDAEPRADAPARLLRLKVPVSVDDLVVPSLVDVYPTANWHERETFDMFGIEFAGHPDLRRILLPETFAGHPLRKDHPLQYEEVAFTHNHQAVTRAKPRASE